MSLLIPKVALRDSLVPAENTGSFLGVGMLNSSWKSFRMTFASSKSSVDDARCGCVAYALDASRALTASGTDLKPRQ